MRAAQLPSSFDGPSTQYARWLVSLPCAPDSSYCYKPSQRQQHAANRKPQASTHSHAHIYTSHGQTRPISCCTGMAVATGTGTATAVGATSPPPAAPTPTTTTVGVNGMYESCPMTTPTFREKMRSHKANQVRLLYALAV